jgi:ubiquinone/menaquinone biosynthesis C-methylase UbiE
MSIFSSTRGFGFFETFLAQQRAKQASKLLPAHVETILDIACGIPPIFLLGVQADKKYGVDIRVPMEHVTLDGITLLPCDAQSGLLPFPSQSMDAVTLLAIVEHLALDEVTNVLREVHRILRPNGTVVITTPAPGTKSILAILAYMHIVSRVEIGDHKELFTRTMIMHALQQAGFFMEKILSGTFECGLNTWYQVKK